MSKRILFALVVLLAAAASAADVLLYCPFDGAAEPAAAAGPKFAVFKRSRYAPGRRGQAIVLTRETTPVTLLEAGNLDKARGSIELWVRPNWNGKDLGDHALLWESGPRGVGGQVIWLWKYGRNIRFDVRDPGDHYLLGSVTRWRAGEWRHIVATWDCRVGTRLYLDGRKVASRDFTWTPRPHAQLVLGQRAGGGLPADAAVDELYIYSRPMSDAEAKAAYEGTLKRTFAQPRPRPRAGAGAAAKPKLLFHLSFDDSPIGADGKGPAKPLVVKGVTFVPGLFGRAAHFGRGAALRYAEQGRLRKERGTLMLWFKPDWTASQTQRPNGSEIWRFLFREGPLEGKRHGSNLMWLWFWGARLRFDVSDALDRYMTRSITEWSRPAWRHIAITWDHTKMRRLYLDGQQVQGGRDSRKPFLPIQWDVRPFPWFAVGGDGRGGACVEGTIDELKIFDTPLSSRAIQQEYARVFPVAVDAAHRYYRAGEVSHVRWRVRNLTSRAIRGALTWSLRGPNGRVAAQGREQRLRFRAGEERTFSRDATLLSPGRYELTLTWRGAGGGVATTQSIAIWAIAREPARKPGGQLSLQLVDDIDLAKPQPKERYVESAPTQVRRTTAGAYREAGPRKNDRFALRVRLPDAAGPYLIDWTYPDDKPRTMEMIAQSVASGSGEYELETGVFCGAEYPLSGKMQTMRCIYWPRRRDVALIFMTCENRRPAAAARVRVWRVKGRLPKLPVRDAAPVNGWTRRIGLYYEDPAMCYDFGGFASMPGFQKTISRLLDYMDWFGQNFFMYPAVWYHGPFYPSASQGVVMSRPHPPNFIEYMLLRFGDRGVQFVPTWNVHSLPSLSDFVWTDDMLITGEAAASPLMIYWNGAPNLGGWHGTGPDYNPLHPKTRAAILGMIDEMLDLYADYPAFRGVCFHLTRHCILWFGDRDAGYNDYCVEAFARDEGLRLPDGGDPAGRVNRRYRWIMAHARERWIAWRCRQIHALYQEVARRLRARRPDLKLVLNVYRPTKAEIMGEDADRYASPDYVRQVWREAGLDPALYTHDSNIVIQRTIYPADYRWYRSHRKYETDPTRIRELNYAEKTYAALRGVPETWINMHDRYWEDPVGRKQRWKSFWGHETGWRVSTLNPTGEHALESYAIPLARDDFRAFTKGGFLVGTIGIEPFVGRFAQAFRALPARRFTTLKRVAGPAVVRYAKTPKGLYFYLVNPTAKPQRVTLRLTGRPRALENLATGRVERIEAGPRRFDLAPYALQPWRVSGEGASLQAR